MNSYISLETATIFFLVTLFLQQGISSEYVMVDFICMGLLEMWAAQTEYILHNEKVLHTLGFKHGTFRLRIPAKRCAISWDIYRVHKYWPHFTCAEYHVVHVVKIFVVYYI